MDKNDPYLSELDAIEDMEEPLESGTGKPQRHADPFAGEEPTRIDHSGHSTHSAPPMDDQEEGDFFEEEGVDPAESEASVDEDEEVAEDLPESDASLLDLAPDISVPLVIVMGRKSYTVQDLLNLHPGQVLDLDRPPLDPVDLVAGGRVIGKGELVEVEGHLGVRILKLFK